MKKRLHEHFTRECNADVVRINKIFDNQNAPFELAYFQVQPGEETIEHNHADSEIFICISGKGKIILDNQCEYILCHDDAWYVDKERFHKIRNDSEEVLKIIAIWWR